jgi:hypothetical protein
MEMYSFIMKEIENSQINARKVKGRKNKSKETKL